MLQSPKSSLGQVDWLTVAALGALLVPLMTMWHELAGHAATCAALGGRVATIGAYYIDCAGLTGWRHIAVSTAGVILNIATAVLAYWLWRLTRRPLVRLVLWYIWLSQAFVAAGYFAFSGITGFGDLGIGTHGGLAAATLPLWFRVIETLIGVGAYTWLIARGNSALTAIIGGGHSAWRSRRRIAHIFYGVAVAGALIVGLANPLGLVVTLMSALASSAGGLAGMISIGFHRPVAGAVNGFTLQRSWALVAAGIVVQLAFALFLGPSITLQPVY